MPSSIKRYQNPQVVEHLAGQYVLGTLTTRVRMRVDKVQQDSQALKDAINYWQNRLAILDQQTAELPPSEVSWQAINQRLELEPIKSKQTAKPQKEKTNWWQQIQELLFTPASTAFAGAMSLCFACVLIYQLLTPSVNTNQLSYVAVLTDSKQQAHLVASTYGETQKLIVNIINQPELGTDETLQLWVVSKSDQLARSLTLLPADSSQFEYQLSQAQWRLIKDSDSLIVTVEEDGGSAIGEPSDDIVSRGLCVRLEEWQNNV